MFKKVLYSNITRVIAYLLLSAVITYAIFSFAITTVNYGDEYSFEDSYKGSYKIYKELHDASTILMEALVDNTDPAAVAEIMKDKNVTYYASAGETVYQSADTDLSNSYPKDASNVYIKRIGKHTEIKKSTAGYEYYFDKLPVGDYTVLVCLSDSRDAHYKKLWGEAKQAFDAMFSLIGILAFAALLLTLYAVVACGRKTDGSLMKMRIDSIFEEIYIALFAICTVMVCGYTYSFIDAIAYGGSKNRQLMLLAALFGGVLVPVCFSLLLPVIRNIKNHSFLHNSMIVRFLSFCTVSLKAGYAIFKKHSTEKSMHTAVCVIIGYTLLVMLLCAITPFASFLLMVAAIIFIIKNMDGATAVIKGIYEIKKGNVEYKITDVGGILEPVAAAVNSIGEGIGEAVEKGIRSERMKSELITNVSHDLKTPLTSVISYAELLCRESLSPEKANDYAEIILEKANRLKKLTSDLFDISKAQSGNVEFKCTKINIALLIRQELAELDDEIQNSGLELCTDIPDAAFVLCDGEKMSRVLENLVQNALKYSMKGTRLYVSVVEENGFVLCSIKNISSYRMDFSGEEITERFIRGDKSRSSEGSGLGLAIAKSYTQGCGGSFGVTVDGDLFKAEIKFKAI